VSRNVDRVEDGVKSISTAVVEQVKTSWPMQMVRSFYLRVGRLLVSFRTQS
jgi:hypothetical protein